MRRNPRPEIESIVEQATIAIDNLVDDGDDHGLLDLEVALAHLSIAASHAASAVASHADTGSDSGGIMRAEERIKLAEHGAHEKKHQDWECFRAQVRSRRKTGA